MGLIDRLFGRPKSAPAGETFYDTFTAYTPTFTSWGGKIYESELVRPRWTPGRGTSGS